MDLHQLQVTYQPEEDRLLYRASFKADDGSLQEVRAWLTRRLAKGLWFGIVKALEAQVALDKPLAAHARGDIVGMEHHASVAGIRGEGNFDTPFDDGTRSFPLGETPILATRADFSQNPGQRIRINLAPAKGPGFEVAFAPAVLHGFCALLKAAVAKAEWELELAMPGEAGAGAGKRTLN